MKRILIFLFFTIPLLADSSLPISFEENGLFGFKNKAGKVIIKPQYEQTMEFTKEKVSFVVSNNRWVCIDTKNNPLLEAFIYDNGPDYYSEKLARFVENKKIGYFDSQCKKLIPAIYDFGFPFEKLPNITIGIDNFLQLSINGASSGFLIMNCLIFSDSICWNKKKVLIFLLKEKYLFFPDNFILNNLIFLFNID